VANTDDPFNIANTKLNALAVTNPNYQFGQAGNFSDALNSLNSFFTIPQLTAPSIDQYNAYFKNLATSQATPTINDINNKINTVNQQNVALGTANRNDIYSRVLQTQGDDLSTLAGQTDFQKRFNIQASRGSGFTDQLTSQISQTTQQIPIQSTTYSDYNPYANMGGK
jgi:hypothetical protein